MNLVTQASNGREVIQQFRQHWPDITRMDLRMPEMNGTDAIGGIIRKEFPAAKIIILTTYESEAPERNETGCPGLLAQEPVG